MTPAPPPPPPAPAPAPTINVSVNLPNKSALLKSIEKGTKLKKAVTNDRSAPLVGSQPNKAASNSTENRPSSSSAGSSVASAAATGMGGLFANGFPKLRSVGEKAARSSVADSVKASVATSALKAAKTSVTESSKKLVQEITPKRAANSLPSPKPAAPKASVVAASVTAPPPLPKKAPKPTAEREISQVQSAMSRTSISSNSERWSFPANVEQSLPAPRKFTSCKKVYLSAQESSSTASSDAKGSGEEISMDDIETFIEALNGKLKSAVADENFEECVRIKGKLKKFDALKKKIKSGESVFTSELP